MHVLGLVSIFIEKMLKIHISLNNILSNPQKGT